MATDAVVVESSPTETLKSLTPAEHKTWRATGNLPEKKAPEAKDSTAVADPSPAAKEVAAPAAEKPASGTPAEPAAAAPEPKAKAINSAEARIKELLAENKWLATQLETSRKAPVAAPAKIEEVAKPRRNDTDPKTGQPKYASDEAFEEAHEAYLTAKVTKDVEQRHAKAQADAKVAEQNRILQQRMANSVKIATEKHPDFLEALGAKTEEKDGKKNTVFTNDAVKAIKTNGVLDAWILDSDIGMEILYYLSKNPGEVERIQSLGAFAAARELTKLEDKLAGSSPIAIVPKPESSTAKPIKVPPEPASSVGGRATAPADGEEAAVKDGDFRRFQREANEAEFRKKKAS